MEMTKFIYEGVVELSYKTTREYATRAGHRRLIRGESSSSNNHPKISESDGKLRKINVDYPEGKYKSTCVIHGSSNSSDECKVLGDFGSAYDKIYLLRTAGTIPYQECLNRNEEKNYIVDSAVDEILLHENQKVSGEKEAHENIESDFDRNKLYQINNTSLDDKKGKLE